MEPRGAYDYTLGSKEPLASVGVWWVSYTRCPFATGLSRPRQNVLANFVIMFQPALQNCEIDYPAGLTQALEQGGGRGHLVSLLSSIH